MKVLPKVKTLLWRACREAMPRKSSLFHRKISPDPLCVRCQASAETPLHALWSCTKLDSVWSDTVLWSNRGSVQYVDFKELLSWQIKNKNQLELYAVTAGQYGISETGFVLTSQRTHFTSLPTSQRFGWMVTKAGKSS